MNLKFLAIIILLLFTALIPAQNKLSIEVTGGKVSKFPEKNILENWDNGWTAGAALKYSTVPNIEFGLNVSFSSLNFDKNSVFLVYPAVCCYRHTITGNNTNLIETSFSMLFFSNNRKAISPFFTFRTGFFYIKTGEILLTSKNYDQYGTEISSGVSLYNNSGKSYFKIFAGAGFGISVLFTENLEMRTQILYNTMLDGSASYFPITSGFNFGL